MTDRASDGADEVGWLIEMNDDDASFELVTWYDTWNLNGLTNLQDKKVPLTYADRYNLAFGSLTAVPSGGYSITMTGQYAEAVRREIAGQAPTAVIYAGLGDTGIAEAVLDNNQHQNRSSGNIVAWLRQNGYAGISLDAENDGMSSVPEFVTQLGGPFKAAGLGIAVSVPWPGSGPDEYGDGAVEAFNSNVDALELQDYSAGGTPNDVGPWIDAGINTRILMGGACTENGGAQTSLDDTCAWTEFALKSGLRGMFSWRLDNDHGDGLNEDDHPTFTGAKAIFDTARPTGNGSS